MKFDITRQSAFSSLVTLLVASIIGVLVLGLGAAPDVDFSAGGSLLSNSLNEWQLSHPWWAAILSAVAIFRTAVWLGRLVSIQNLYGISTTIHIPIIGVLMWSVALSPHFLLSTIVLILSAYILGSLLKSVSSNDLSHIFNAMFLFSLLPLFYPSAMLIFLAIPIILFFVSITLREWIVGVVGALLPIFGACYIYWLMGHDFFAAWDNTKELLYSHSGISSLEELPLFGTIIFLLLLTLSLLSTLWLKELVGKSNLRLKCALVLLTVSMVTVLSPSFSMLTTALAAPSIAILASLSLVRMRGKATNSIYVILMVLLLLESMLSGEKSMLTIFL